MHYSKTDNISKDATVGGGIQEATRAQQSREHPGSTAEEAAGRERRRELEGKRGTETGIRRERVSARRAILVVKERMVEEAETEGLGWDYFQEGMNYEVAHEGVRGSSGASKALLGIAVIAGGAALCYWAVNNLRANEEEAANSLRPVRGGSEQRKQTVANVEDGTAGRRAPASPQVVSKMTQVITDKNNGPEVRALAPLFLADLPAPCYLPMIGTRIFCGKRPGKTVHAVDRKLDCRRGNSSFGTSLSKSRGSVGFIQA